MPTASEATVVASFSKSFYHLVGEHMVHKALGKGIAHATEDAFAELDI